VQRGDRGFKRENPIPSSKGEKNTTLFRGKKGKGSRKEGDQVSLKEPRAAEENR